MVEHRGLSGNDPGQSHICSNIEQLYRQHTGQMLAYLTSLFQDVELAQEAWHEVIADALQTWHEKMPHNPGGWLKVCARNKAIDKLRQQKMSREKAALIKAIAVDHDDTGLEEMEFADQQLKLIFTCCHPALELDKQVPLTLTLICGLSTQQVAEALLVNVKSLEQRLTRAKRKMKQAGIPFSVPVGKELSPRLGAVLSTLYLLFNHGVNHPCDTFQLQKEAIRLANLINTMLPNEPELKGLLALMMFHRARHQSRFNAKGELVLLDQQDRKLWDQQLIAQAHQLLSRTLKQQQVGSYQLQAAIQGVHCHAATANATDWPQITALYALLEKVDPSPVVSLNSAVAYSMLGDVNTALRKLEPLNNEPTMRHYSPYYLALAEVQQKLGNSNAYESNLRQALHCCTTPHEKQSLLTRLSQLDV